MMCNGYTIENLTTLKKLFDHNTLHLDKVPNVPMTRGCTPSGAAL